MVKKQYLLTYCNLNTVVQLFSTHPECGEPPSLIHTLPVAGAALGTGKCCSRSLPSWTCITTLPDLVTSRLGGAVLDGVFRNLMKPLEVLRVELLSPFSQCTPGLHSCCGQPAYAPFHISGGICEVCLLYRGPLQLSLALSKVFNTWSLLTKKTVKYRKLF